MDKYLILIKNLESELIDLNLEIKNIESEIKEKKLSVSNLESIITITSNKINTNQIKIDDKRNMKKYEKPVDRKCVFVCVLTGILRNGEKIIARGECKGTVAKEHGKLGGLTYIPIFIPEGFDKPMSDIEDKTLEEMHNHRELAVKIMIQNLKDKKMI